MSIIRYYNIKSENKVYNSRNALCSDNTLLSKSTTNIKSNKESNIDNDYKIINIGIYDDLSINELNISYVLWFIWLIIILFFTIYNKSIGLYIIGIICTAIFSKTIFCCFDFDNKDDLNKHFKAFIIAHIVYIITFIIAGIMLFFT